MFLLFYLFFHNSQNTIFSHFSLPSFYAPIGYSPLSLFFFLYFFLLHPRTPPLFFFFFFFFFFSFFSHHPRTPSHFFYSPFLSSFFLSFSSVSPSFFFFFLSQRLPLHFFFFFLSQRLPLYFLSFLAVLDFIFFLVLSLHFSFWASIFAVTATSHIFFFLIFFFLFSFTAHHFFIFYFFSIWGIEDLDLLLCRCRCCCCCFRYYWRGRQFARERKKSFLFPEGWIVAPYVGRATVHQPRVFNGSGRLMFPTFAASSPFFAVFAQIFSLIRMLWPCIARKTIENTI